MTSDTASYTREFAWDQARRGGDESIPSILMGMVPIKRGEGTLSNFTFDSVAGAETLSAPQAPGTHALVQNPFAWND